jgi:hypothetical protein
LSERSQQIANALEHQVDALITTLTHGLGKVATRFVRDMLLGMELSHSPRLSDIAAALDENIGLRATHKRLSRNAARKELAPTLSSNMLQHAADRVQDETLLYLDWPNLLKNRALRMENLAAISNTKGEPIGKGYRLAQVVASELTTDGMLPLAQAIWSEQDAETDFLTNTLDLVSRVRKATGNRGIVIADRSADHPGILEPWTADPGSRYIVRLRRHTELKYGHLTLTSGELAHRCRTPYGRNVPNLSPEEAILRKLGFLDRRPANATDKSPDLNARANTETKQSDSPMAWEYWVDGKPNPVQFLHFGQLPVRLAAVPDRQLAMIVVHGTVDGPMILLTTEPARNNRAVLTVLVEAYLKRWRVGIATQQFHDRHRFSRIRVLSFERILNLTALAFSLEYMHALAHEQGGIGFGDELRVVDAGIDLYRTRDEI